MFWNNLKTLFYHTLWYIFLGTFFVMAQARSILERFVPSGMNQILFMGVATLLISAIITALFMQAKGSYSKNVFSNFTLMLLDALVVLGMLWLFMNKQLTIFQLAMVVIFLILQITLVISIMQSKQKRLQRRQA